MGTRGPAPAHAFRSTDMPGVEWRGEVAVMPEMGKAAWFDEPANL